MSEFDWQGAYARLDRARRALETTGERPREEVRQILAARARALARPQAEAQAPTDKLELLVFSLGALRYAIETAYVQEVVPLRALTPVPCTPPFVLGVVNHRGQILPVLDLRGLFETAGVETTQAGRVVAVEAAGMLFGIFANAVGGTIQVQAQALSPPPAAVATDRQPFLRGVTAEMVAVLDVGALARDRGFAVNQATG